MKEFFAVVESSETGKSVKNSTQRNSRCVLSESLALIFTADFLRAAHIFIRTYTPCTPHKIHAYIQPTKNHLANLSTRRFREYIGKQEEE